MVLQPSIKYLNINYIIILSLLI